MIRAWVALWDRREPATSLALIRLALGAILLLDLAEAWALGLAPVMWTPQEAGGLPADLLQREVVPELYRWFAPEPSTAIWAAGLATLALACFTLGLGAPVAAVVFVLLYAQLARTLPLGDRAIDTAARNIILLLACSGSHAKWSIDAWRRTGRWGGDGRLVTAWPRYLIIVQLVLLYWCAGSSKSALAWTPLGHYDALYLILQDPHIARFDFGFADRGLPLLLLRVGTAVTHLWEWTIPVILLAYWYRDTRDRPGRLRRLFLKLRVREIYVVIGVVLHLGIWATMRIGIFPFAMLALYPAWFHPDELGRAWLKISSRRRAAAPKVSGVQREGGSA